MSILHHRAYDAPEGRAIASVWRVAARAMMTIKLGGTIFFTLVATMVVLVSQKTSVNLGVNNQLLTVLGLVLGFVISFRTSSAYERYQDGRRMWTNIIVASRSLAHQIWVHVQVDEPRGINTPLKRPSSLEILEEKQRMIKLVQAFSVSVKHLLRGEESVYYKDLWPLVHFLPQFTPGTNAELRLWHIHERHATLSPASSEYSSPKIPSHPTAEPKDCTSSAVRFSNMEDKRLDMEKNRMDSMNSMNITVYAQSVRALTTDDPSRPTRTTTYVSMKEDELSGVPPCKYVLAEARTPPTMSIFEYFTFLKYLRFAWRVVTGSSHPAENSPKARRRKNYTEIVTVHVPIEICLVLSNYVNFLMKNQLVDPIISSNICNNLFLLQDTVSNLERICNTPLPFAYQAHLKISLWLYLFLLPFQIYSNYASKYITIPATAFAAFLLLGFVDIAEEIENPFDYDFNDLDLDHFCSIVKRDIHEITTYTNLEEKNSLLFGASWR